MKKVVLRGRIIDGTGNGPISDGVIVINRNIIENIGSTRSVKIPKNSKIIDVGKKSILPGLIDSHIHFYGITGLDPTQWIIEPMLLRAMRVAASCELLINAGFTAVRDVGGFGVYLKKALQEGSIKKGPRIFAANRVLSQTGGHGDIHSFPIEFVKTNKFVRICDGETDCIKAAREQFREGADFIKICSTGGILSERDKPEDSQFTFKEICAIVEESSKVGTYVASHAQGAKGIVNALKAGVKTIEHGIYLDEEGIELMLKSKAILVPTFSIIYRLCKHGKDYGIPEYALEKVKTTQGAHIEAIKKAKAAGVKIALGTDFLNVPLLPFGENSLELELFVSILGLSSMEAIIAGTKIGAEVLQMSDKIGTLEKGKLADMIVVDGDPIYDICCLRKPDNILLVIKDGKVEKDNLLLQ